MNRHRAARGLVEALASDDTEAARRVGVTPATVENWRKRLPKDPELAALYAEGVRAMDGRWRRELQDVVVQAAADIRGLEARVYTLVIDVLDHPEEHLDEEGRTPTAIERVKFAQVAIASARATMEKGTEILTHYEAIVAPERRTDGAPETHSTNGTAPAGSVTVADGTAAHH